MFHTYEIDWLNVYDVQYVDAEEIERLRDRNWPRGSQGQILEAKSEHPFQLRVSTGSNEDQKGDDIEGGVSLDIFREDRKRDNEHPLLTIRLPWEAVRPLARFLSCLPDEDPEM